MKVKNIFFDFDGVLAESVHIKTEAFRKMYLSYGEEFSQKVVDYHIENGGVSRFDKFKVWNGEWLKEDISDGRINELALQFSKLVLEGVINSEEVKGASFFLKSASHYKKYIITGTPTVEIKKILKGRGMNYFFEGAYGSPEKKEYWVDKILKEENLLSEESIFIGDAMADYNAAKLNHITFVLRETIEGGEIFQNYKGYRIKNITELQSVIEKINLLN